MKLGISVRSNSDSYFVKKRYLDFFKEFEIIFLYPYINTHAYAQCDGFVIIGGDDANPILYGEENYASHGICDEIDRLDFQIIEYAASYNKPLFGICRGLQMINIFFKGTLKQHVLNHDVGSHKIVLVDQFLDFPELEIVNSFHHQSVKKTGENLRVLYYSLDGEIECFIHEKHPFIAVQFHPEMDKNNQFYRMVMEYFKSLLHFYKQ